MKKANMAIGSAVILVALSGCQGLTSVAGLGDRAPQVSTETSSYFAQLIQEGRLHLRANRPGSAIVSFRRASYHSEFAGEAYNGMAVSYHMMGRNDLAERFFLAAIEADPEDARFARNLARFEDSTSPVESDVRLAERAPDQELVLEDGSQTSTVQAAVLVAGPEPLQRVQRVSAREVHIASRDQVESGPIAAVGRIAPAVVNVETQRRPELVQTTGAGGRYPVTFSISDIPDAHQDSPIAQSTRSAFVSADQTVRVRVKAAPAQVRHPAYPISFSFNPS